MEYSFDLVDFIDITSINSDNVNFLLHHSKHSICFVLNLKNLFTPKNSRKILRFDFVAAVRRSSCVM
jgi:hypothetical protein